MTTDPKPSAQEVLNLYCDLMAEIKVRIAAVGAALAGHLPIHPLVAYEFCHLELRIACELIALACLVAHGDIEATHSRRLKKAYQADLILNALEQLHPNFYPIPGRQVHDSTGRLVGMNRLDSDFLRKSDLIRLYASCGQVLHRGNIKNLRPNLNTAWPFEDVARSTNLMIHLLDHHQIALYDSTAQIWVAMHTEGDGRPSAGLMELVDPAAPDS